MEPRTDFALTCRKSDNLDDWYLIEWAHHDHTSGFAAVAPRVIGYTHSGRVSDADVEGTADDMREIAAAIEAGGSFSERRCAVETDGDRVEFWSPRNSQDRQAVPRAVALALAAEIRAMLDAPAPVSP